MEGRHKMKIEKEKIKLNIPCSICDKELFLGTSLVSFGDNRTPVHLECYNKAGKSEAIKQVMKIIDKIEIKPNPNSVTQYNPYVFSEQLKSKLGELTK